VQKGVDGDHQQQQAQQPLVLEQPSAPQSNPSHVAAVSSPASAEMLVRDVRCNVAEEPARDLLALAHRYQYRLTPRTLKRWHLAGYLPAPTQRSLGRRGTIAFYPAGTGRQLLALCRLRDRDRRLRFAALELWLDGHAVSLDRVRADLRDLAGSIERVRTYLRALGFGRRILPSAARSRLRSFTSGRLAGSLGSGMRRRLGAEDFEELVRAILETMLGRYRKPDWIADVSEDPERTLERGLALDRARQDRLLDAGPWLSGDGDVLDALSRMMSTPLTAVCESGDAELLVARREFVALTYLLREVGARFALEFGPHRFGFTVISKLLSHADAFQMGGMFLLWLRMRQESWAREGLPPLLELATEWERRYVFVFQLLDDLRREVPPLGHLIAARRIRVAMRSREQLALFQVELRQAVAQHAGLLREFAARHDLSVLADGN